MQAAPLSQPKRLHGPSGPLNYCLSSVLQCLAGHSHDIVAFVATVLDLILQTNVHTKLLRSTTVIPNPIATAFLIGRLSLNDGAGLPMVAFLFLVLRCRSTIFARVTRGVTMGVTEVL